MRCGFFEMCTAGLGPAQARVFHDIVMAEPGRLPFGIHAKAGAGAGAGARARTAAQYALGCCGIRYRAAALARCWESWCNQGI